MNEGNFCDLEKSFSNSDFNLKMSSGRERIAELTPPLDYTRPYAARKLAFIVATPRRMRLEAVGTVVPRSEATSVSGIECK